MPMDHLNASSKEKSKLNYYLLLIVIFGGFLIFGLSENVKGPAIPIIQTDFLLSESQIGFLLAINSLGYLIACTFTAALSNRIGIKWTGIVAFASMAVSGICLYFSEKYFALSSSYFLLYIGNGMLEIGLGIMAARIFTKNTGFMMNLAHFFYGLSSMVAPIIASWMMKWTIAGGELSWRGMYFIVLLLALLPIIPSFFGKFPEEETNGEENVSYRILLRDPVAWLIVMILSFGVVSELAVGGWLVNFLIKAYSWNIETASGMLSMFFLFFMLSRLIFGPLTDRIGYTLSIMIFAAFSGICSFAAIIIGEKGAILFAIAGIGIAPIYPTVMALLAKRYPKGTGTAITFTVTLMGIASVLGNLLIGVIIEGINRLFHTSNGVIGQQAGYGFIALLSLLCSICCVILFYYLRKKRELI
jgi:MFS family permease